MELAVSNRHAYFKFDVEAKKELARGHCSAKDIKEQRRIGGRPHLSPSQPTAAADPAAAGGRHIAHAQICLFPLLEPLLIAQETACASQIREESLIFHKGATGLSNIIDNEALSYSIFFSHLKK